MTQDWALIAEKSLHSPDNSIIISSVSAWEIATKYRIGKLPEAKQLVEEYSQILLRAKFIELPITTAHALRAGSLPIDHRDPFDRMIMATAEIENLPVITYDVAFQTGLIQVIPTPSKVVSKNEQYNNTPNENLESDT